MRLPFFLFIVFLGYRLWTQPFLDPFLLDSHSWDEAPISRATISSRTAVHGYSDDSYVADNANPAGEAWFTYPIVASLKTPPGYGTRELSEMTPNGIQSGLQSIATGPSKYSKLITPPGSARILLLTLTRAGALDRGITSRSPGAVFKSVLRVYSAPLDPLVGGPHLNMDSKTVWALDWIETLDGHLDHVSLSPDHSTIALALTSQPSPLTTTPQVLLIDLQAHEQSTTVSIPAPKVQIPIPGTSPITALAVDVTRTVHIARLGDNVLWRSYMARPNAPVVPLPPGPDALDPTEEAETRIRSNTARKVSPDGPSFLAVTGLAPMPVYPTHRSWHLGDDTSLAEPPAVYSMQVSLVMERDTTVTSQVRMYQALMQEDTDTVPEASLEAVKHLLEMLEQDAEDDSDDEGDEEDTGDAHDDYSELARQLQDTVGDERSESEVGQSPPGARSAGGGGRRRSRHTRAEQTSLTGITADVLTSLGPGKGSQGKRPSPGRSRSTGSTGKGVFSGGEPSSATIPTEVKHANVAKTPSKPAGSNVLRRPLQQTTMSTAEEQKTIATRWSTIEWLESDTVSSERIHLDSRAAVEFSRVALGGRMDALNNRYWSKHMHSGSPDGNTLASIVHDGAIISDWYPLSPEGGLLWREALEEIRSMGDLEDIIEENGEVPLGVWVYTTVSSVIASPLTAFEVSPTRTWMFFSGVDAEPAMLQRGWPSEDVGQQGVELDWNVAPYAPVPPAETVPAGARVVSAVFVEDAARLDEEGSREEAPPVLIILYEGGSIVSYGLTEASGSFDLSPWNGIRSLTITYNLHRLLYIFIIFWILQRCAVRLPRRIAIRRRRFVPPVRIGPRPPAPMAPGPGWGPNGPPPMVPPVDGPPPLPDYAREELDRAGVPAPAEVHGREQAERPQAGEHAGQELDH